MFNKTKIILLYVTKTIRIVLNRIGFDNSSMRVELGASAPRGDVFTVLTATVYLFDCWIRAKIINKH